MDDLLPMIFSPGDIIFYLIIIFTCYFLFRKQTPVLSENGKRKHVVIVGGGFAGVAAAIHLKRSLRGLPIKITLINKHNYHLFTPSLYEVATSEETKKNVAIPLKKIFPTGVHIIHNIVEKIDTAFQMLTLKDKEKIAYDYLILTTGSQPAYMGIPGLKEYATGFKSLQDALTIKDKIKNLCCKDGKCNKKVQVVIGGGGFAGTELAAELLTYKDRIAVQHKLDKNCLEMTIIQGSDKLLKELDPKVSNIAEKRLDEPNVHFAFGGHISQVTKDKILTDNGKSYPYEIFIWTGGVTPNELARNNNLPVTKRGALLVNEYLQIQGFENIFAAGDSAGYVIDETTQRTAPNVAQVAEEQGQTAGKNVARLLLQETLEPYKFRHWGYVVPLKGYFAVAELVHDIQLAGFSGWILQQLVLLRYLFGILPIWRALERFDEFEMEMDKR
ncbi:MAG: NAD(P)/FAD-dependent oxidoreductase [Candidatus Levyibacteriota bacterium]